MVVAPVQRVYSAVKFALDKNNSDSQSFLRDYASALGVGVLDLISPKRSAEMVYLRTGAYVVLRKRFALSYPQIGRLFHKNHATIIHSLNAHSAELKLEDLLNGSVDVSSSNESRGNSNGSGSAHIRYDTENYA